MFKSKFVACTSVVLFVLLINTPLFAQGNDTRSVVEFTDGSVVQGKIIKLTSEKIKIETEPGKIVARPFDDVYSISDESAPVNQKTRKAAQWEKAETIEQAEKKVKPFPDTWNKKFAIGGRIGTLYYKGDNFKAGSTEVDIDIDTAFIYGVNFEYFVNQYFSMELDLSHTNEVDADLNALGVGIEAGNLTITPVTLTARVHIPTGTAFYPYIGAGIGYYFNDLNRNEAFWWDANDKLDLDDCLGYHFNLGTDIFFNDAKNVALNIDLRYTWIEADVNYSGPTLGSGTLSAHLDSFISSMGLKYFF